MQTLAFNLSTWHIVATLFILLLLGFLREFRDMRKIVQNRDLIAEFLNEFIEWCNSKGEDRQRYAWLMSKSTSVQRILGVQGLIAMRRPFESGYHSNVPVILNLIPEIQDEINSGLYGFNSIARDNLGKQIRLVDDCLRRYIGFVEDELKEKQKRLTNPLALFSGGVSCLLGLPLLVLSELGLLSTGWRIQVTSGTLFSWFSGIVALVSLLAAAMSIALGWEEFWALLTRWLPG